MNHKWTQVEVRELIFMWKKFYPRLHSNKRNGPKYNIMAEQINLNLQLEDQLSGYDVYKKIENLKKQFRRQRKRIMEERCPPRWWPFTMVQEVMDQPLIPDEDDELLAVESAQCKTNEAVNRMEADLFFPPEGTHQVNHKRNCEEKGGESEHSEGSFSDEEFNPVIVKEEQEDHRLGHKPHRSEVASSTSNKGSIYEPIVCLDVQPCSSAKEPSDGSLQVSEKDDEDTSSFETESPRMKSGRLRKSRIRATPRRRANPDKLSTLRDNAQKNLEIERGEKEGELLVGGEVLKDKCKYECTNCDFRSFYKYSLKLHVNTVHKKIRPFQCKQCDYQSSQKNGLLNHIKSTHRVTSSFCCSFCDYKCTKNGSLVAHFNSIHKKIYRLFCDLCDFKCNKKSSMKYHATSVHTKEKSVKCSECSYCTSQKANLIIHEAAVHRQDYSFSCESCDYKSARKHNLELHVKACHKNKEVHDL